MNKIILLVLLNFIYKVNTIGQENMKEWDLYDAQHSAINVIIEGKDSFFYVITNPIINTGKFKFSKFNNLGRIVDSVFVDTDTVAFSIMKAIWIENKSEYLLVGQARTNTSILDDRVYYLATALIGEDLKVKNITYSKLPFKKGIYFIGAELRTENYIDFVCSSSNGSGLLTDNFLTRISINGYIIKEKVVYGEQCYSLVKTNDNNIMCVGSTSYVFDENLEFVQKLDKPFRHIPTTNQSRVIRLANNRLLMGNLSAADSPDLYKNGGAMLYYLNEDLSPQKFNGIVTPRGTVLANRIFDFSPDSSLYIGTTDASTFQFKTFSLGKFNQNLDLKWQLQYFDANYGYRLVGLKCTSDNGVILYGTRLTDLGSQAYMIKFNENGNISWTHNVDKDFLLIKSYPNPSIGPLNIDIQGITGHADVRVYDMQGRNVYVQEGIGSGATTMDLSGLAAGTYIYKIYDGSRVIGSGEWVKM